VLVKGQGLRRLKSALWPSFERLISTVAGCTSNSNGWRDGTSERRQPGRPAQVG
jgi:hypothetical protein